MKRRQFLGSIGAAAAALPLREHGGEMTSSSPLELDERGEWISAMMKLAAPVLGALAENRLKETMPVEERPSPSGESRRTYAHLEAFGRLMSGICPWLALPVDESPEGKERSRFVELARRSIENAVDPKAKDYMNFSAGSQPLVDAAFLALGLLRAPSFWGSLPSHVKLNVLHALRSTRRIQPHPNNWLLFSAMIEAFLCFAGEDYDRSRIDYAFEQHERWYKGDGMFGDGAEFHWDYYNSYVIHPFIRMILEIIGPQSQRHEAFAHKFDKIALRQAVIQERLIGPDGSFPAIGRSIAYRCGAFHHLANETLLQRLPKSLAAGQVRRALWAAITRTLLDRENYDAGGWLVIGLNGHQPQLGEGYICTGSLYLAATAFLPLGLAGDQAFWTSPATDWTSKHVWSGKDLPADSALKL